MTGFNGLSHRRTADEYGNKLDADILAHWCAGRDTLDIARALAVPESLVANRVPRILEQRRINEAWERASA